MAPALSPDQLLLRDEQLDPDTALEQAPMATPEWMAQFFALATLIAEGAMVFGGVVPFAPQMVVIRRARSCKGFNTLVCFNLLMANILRILFWFGRPFELPLLAQSVLMVATMLYMMHVCVGTYKFDTGRKKMSLFDFNFGEFWLWSDFSDYLVFVAAFTVLVGTFTWVGSDQWLVIEGVGFLAVFVEAMQGVPQFIKNHKHKSTEGMSTFMPCAWLSGDTFKTVYFFSRNAPLQFGACGALQICVDLALLGQVWMYRNNREPLMPTKKMVS